MLWYMMAINLSLLIHVDPLVFLSASTVTGNKNPCLLLPLFLFFSFVPFWWAFTSRCSTWNECFVYSSSRSHSVKVYSKTFSFLWCSIFHASYKVQRLFLWFSFLAFPLRFFHAQTENGKGVYPKSTPCIYFSTLSNLFSSVSLLATETWCQRRSPGRSSAPSVLWAACWWSLCLSPLSSPTSVASTTRTREQTNAGLRR